MTMGDDATKTVEEDDAKWVIQDWWPAVGDSYAEYLNAVRRAGGV